MRKILGSLVLLAAATVALLWLRPPDSPPAQPTPTLTTTPTLGAAAPTTAAHPPATASASPTSKPSPTAITHTQPLHGQALAVAWLNGYLNRAGRDDDDWSHAISSLTAPELVDQLKALGPNNVGLYQLKSWRVTKVTGYDPPDKPVDTPSRQVLTYTATITDGHISVDKPFELYSYLAEDGRWVITFINQPYTSEG